MGLSPIHPITLQKSFSGQAIIRENNRRTAVVGYLLFPSLAQQTWIFREPPELGTVREHYNYAPTLAVLCPLQILC